ncbi:acyl-CoA dehydrogenase/oxidase C-terminal [Syncephalis fuscata]|nr:acyl-CoA dehydrogenase/oxidase C-terminal [Syncephalis fuscata]
MSLLPLSPAVRIDRTKAVTVPNASPVPKPSATFPSAVNYESPLIRSWQQHPSLARERSLASFTARELTHIINGNAARTERIEAIRQLLEQEPIFDKINSYHLCHEDLYLRELQIMERFKAVCLENRWSTEDKAIAYDEIYDDLSVITNNNVVIQTLKSQGTEEQQALWVPLAENWAILGCYVQTEMAHGSNIRGIETTATFLPATDEIELNTSTLSSVKWWVGGMGKTANMALIMAQLVLPNGHHAGVFPFMVQVRSFKDHTLLPGVETGDIGPNFGYNSIDIGYLVLKKVRIPRINMLMRHVELTRRPKARLWTLLNSRVAVISQASSVLSIGCTIATRYSVVRHQFSHSDANRNAPEVAILDHQSQQHRVLVPLSEAYAFHFAGQRLGQLYRQCISPRLSSSAAAGLLARVHTSASALKPYMTSRTSESLETLRRACGGHGYSQFSGMPSLVASYAQFNTGEGENHVMVQQAARSLLRRYEFLQMIATASHTASADERYMLPVPMQQQPYKRCSAMIANDLCNQRCICTHFSVAQLITWRAYINARNKAHHLQSAMSMLNELSVHMLSSGEAAPIDIPQPIHSVLSRLCDLFALSCLSTHLGDHLEAGYLQPTHGPLIRAAIRQLLQEIRPDALALVDAFNLSDRRLGSALGRWDGRVYEALAAMAQSSPMNRTDVTPGYEPPAGALAIDGHSYQGLKGIFEDGWHRVGHTRIPAKL